MHTFDNGVRVFADQLHPNARQRYRVSNLHEPMAEQLFLDLLEGIPDGGTYVNVGSGLGYYPLLARRRRSDVVIHAYEPLQRHRDSFLQNILLNGFASADFQIHPEAVSAGAAKMRCVDHAYSSQLVRKSAVAERFWQLLRPLFGRRRIPYHRVEVLPLARVLERAGGRIDLLQMDAQGSELEILSGDQQLLGERTIRRLLIATHGEEIHGACLRVLLSCGFDVIANSPGRGATGDGALAALVHGESSQHVHQQDMRSELRNRST